MSDAERLREIQSELAEVLEARLGDLEELAKQTGSMSHTLLAVEMELGRYRDGKNKKPKSDLMEGLKEIERELEQVLQNRLGEVADALKRNERVSRRLLASEAEVDRLTGEQRALEQENKALETKLKALEENVVRMRRLKEDKLLTMAGLTQDMQGMAGGKE